MNEHIKDGDYNLIFNADGTAHEVDDYNYVKRVGVHPIVYSQKEIVDKINEAYNSGNLDKGILQDYGYAYKFVFQYKYVDANNFVHNPRIRLSVQKELVDDKSASFSSICSMNYSAISQICGEIVRVRNINRVRIEREKRKIKLKRKQRFILAIGGAALTLLAVKAIDYSLKDAGEFEKNVQKSAIERINDQRIKKGIPPLGIVDKNGRQYDSWEDYYKDFYANESKNENDTLENAYKFLQENENVFPKEQTDDQYNLVNDTESYHI